MQNEVAYRTLFERFEDMIIEQGEPVGMHSWNSGAPGAGAGVTYIYRFRGLFVTSIDFGIDGPYEGFSEAAEAVSLLTVTDATERIWVDYNGNPDSANDDDDQKGC